MSCRYIVCDRLTDAVLWYFTSSFSESNFTTHKKYFPEPSLKTLKCWIWSANLLTDKAHVHTYVNHLVLTFPGELSLAGYLLNFPSPFIPILCTVHPHETGVNSCHHSWRQVNQKNEQQQQQPLLMLNTNGTPVNSQMTAFTAIFCLFCAAYLVNSWSELLLYLQYMTSY